MATHITESQVAELLTATDAYDAVKRAHIDLSSGTADNVVRSRARAKSMSLHSLSAASDSLGMAAAKIYSATRCGVHSTILLYDTESGDLLATIEANELGRRRTAAASSVAASVLYSESSCRLGIIGAGYQGLGLLAAFSDQSFRPEVESISVFSRTETKRKAFVEQAGSLTTAHIASCSSAEEVAKTSDILLLATTSSQPVVDTSWLESVSCICAIGSNALSRKELPPRAITAASIVVVDSLEVAKLEAGDLLSPIENGKLRWSQVEELGGLLTDTDKKFSRGSAGNYSLFCSQGLALQDLYSAELVYKRLGGSNTR